MSVGAELVEQLERILDGQLPPFAFERWLISSGLAAPLERETSHLPPAEQEAAIWRSLRARFGTELPEERLRERARGICDGLMRGTIDPVDGVRAMRIVRHQLPEGGRRWLELADALADVPSAAEAERWDPEALASRRDRLEELRPAIAEAARETRRALG